MVSANAQYSIVAIGDLTHLSLMCQSEAGIAGPRWCRGGNLARPIIVVMVMFVNLAMLPMHLTWCYRGRVATCYGRVGPAIRTTFHRKPNVSYLNVFQACFRSFVWAILNHPRLCTFAAGAIVTVYYSDVDGITNGTISVASGGENCRQKRFVYMSDVRTIYGVAHPSTCLQCWEVSMREESCVPVHQKKNRENWSISNY